MEIMKPSGKKAQGVFGIVVGVLVIAFLVFAVSLASSYLMSPLKEISDDINADPEMSQEAKDIITASETHFLGFWDGVIVFALVMLWISNVITAFFVDSHPVFFILTFVLLIFAFIVVAMLANEYDLLSSDEYISDNAQYFSKTRWIVQNLLQICIVMSVSYLVPIYAKVR